MALYSELENKALGEVLFLEEPENNELNRKWYKKLKTTYKAKPFFEHLYMNQNLPIVETRRESNQRPSYTIAARLNHL